MLIIATALAVGHWVTESGAPARFVEFLLSHNFATWQFLLAINALLLVLGCFLEVTATLLLVLPILAPALKPMGVDPPIVVILVFAMGFAAGYGLRAWISARRRKVAKRWAGLPFP